MAVTAFFMFLDTLPEPLLEYAKRDESFALLDVLDLASLIAAISASIGLYFFGAGPDQFMLGAISLSVSAAFASSSVEPSIVVAMPEIALLISGLIIGVSYFLESRALMLKKPLQSTLKTIRLHFNVRYHPISCHKE